MMKMDVILLDEKMGEEARRVQAIGCSVDPSRPSRRHNQPPTLIRTTEVSISGAKVSKLWDETNLVSEST